MNHRTRASYTITCFSNVQDVCLLDTPLLLSGDVELNPGPQNNTFHKCFHWNFNSICARGIVKISLIETYDSLYKYDINAISECMLDSSVLSHEKLKINHPPLYLGPEVIATIPEHKHLGVTLDSKLNFESHIRKLL